MATRLVSPSAPGDRIGTPAEPFLPGISYFVWA